MRLKTFPGADLASAMARVRAELGPDSVIVSVDERGGETRVVAAMERLAPEDEFLESVVLRAPEGARPRCEEQIGAALDRHGVPPRLAGRLLSAARASGMGEANRALGAALASTLRFAALDPVEPVVAVGPYGAGKTATIGKLAARAAVAGRSVGLVTTDLSRGINPLHAYARLISADLIAADDSHALTAARGALRNKAVILMDTPGFDLHSEAERSAMAETVAAADARVLAVLPAGLDAEESGELACRLAELGATALAATRLDASRRLGGVLAAADAGGVALAEAGIGASLADGLAPLTSELLADRLLGQRPQENALKGAA